MCWLQSQNLVFMCKIIWVWIFADWKCLCSVVYWRARGWDSRLIASFIFRPWQMYFCARDGASPAAVFVRAALVAATGSLYNWECDPLEFGIYSGRRYCRFYTLGSDKSSLFLPLATWLFPARFSCSCDPVSDGGAVP